VTGPTPELDARTLPALLAALTADARTALPGWTPPADGDAGTALYRIFARFVELALARLNGVPDKTLLAFLDAMGIEQLPAAPARAPLVFGLAPGAPATLVPAGTQVSAPATATGPEVVFETEQDLLALPAGLVAARTVDPVWDRGSDLSDLLGRPALDPQQVPRSRLAFVGDTPLDHVLHVGDELIFDPGRSTTLVLAVGYRSAAPADELLAFFQSLELSCDTPAGPRVLPLTIGLAGSIVYLEATLPPIAPATLAGVGLPGPVTGGWLRFRLPAPRPDAGVPDDLVFGTRQLDVLGTDLLPDAVLTGTTPVDPTADFLPFGPQPQPGGALLIRADQALARARQVTLSVDVAGGTAATGLVLAWEYLGASGWTAVTGTAAFPTEAGTLTKTGAVQLTLPPVPLAQVGTQRGRWLRVRIGAGGYGGPVEYEPVNAADLSKGYRVKAGTGTLDPPRLRSLRLSYAARADPWCVVQAGDLHQPAGAEFQPYPALAELPAPYADPGPVLYLGFAGLGPQQPVSLYVDVPVTELARPPLPAPPLPGAGDLGAGVRWEYFDGTGWRELTVFDGTADLTLSGLVSLITPADIAGLARFDLAPLTWLRVRAASNDPLTSQRITTVLANAATAVATLTVNGEVLGSGTGEPGQTYRAARTPVQPGQQLLVAEPQGLPADEAAVLAAELGPGVPVTRPDPGGTGPTGPSPAGLGSARSGSAGLGSARAGSAGGEQVWVCWHEVPNLVRSGPGSRHYTVDRATGTIGFGDGEHGLIPPRGAGNLVLSYRAGGGAAGNVPPGGAAQLRTPVPGVVSVGNPVAADGGADAEPLAAARERGARVVRHRGRAVAAADVEWLARQAAGTRVARAICLPNLDRRLAADPGWLSLLVIPSGAGATPRPAPGLVRTVADYLTARGPVSLAGLNVVGPAYLRVTVDADIVPRELAEADAVKQRIAAALDGYFHPVTGGPAGTGWTLGRPVFISEVAQLLAGVDGVSHLHALALTGNLVQTRLALAASPRAPVRLPAGCPVRTADGAVVGLLAGAIPAGAPIDRLDVTGFREGDQLTYALDLTVTAAPDATGTTQVIQTGGPRAVVFPPGRAGGAAAMGFPRGSVVRAGPHLTRLSRGLRLPAPTGEIMLGDPPPAPTGEIRLVDPLPLAAGDRLTVYRPFASTVTGVRTGPDGGLTVTVRLPAPAPAVPPGSILSTVDGRVRSPVLADLTGGQLAVRGFAAGDPVVLGPGRPGDPELDAVAERADPVADHVHLEPYVFAYSAGHRIRIVP
jgi:uncharacterized phage protein gp47/JayE